jgi:hypothetical protein
MGSLHEIISHLVMQLLGPTVTTNEPLGYKEHCCDSRPVCILRFRPYGA